MRDENIAKFTTTHNNTTALFLFTWFEEDHFLRESSPLEQSAKVSSAFHSWVKSCLRFHAACSLPHCIITRVERSSTFSS